MSMALRDALFERGENIADPDVLLRHRHAASTSTPLDLRTAEQAVRCDWERGKARGVQGSPHFFVGDNGWFCPSLDIAHKGERSTSTRIATRCATSTPPRSAEAPVRAQAFCLRRYMLSAGGPNSTTSATTAAIT